jgi:hypothetical protein
MQLFLDGAGVLLEHWRSLLFLTVAALGYGGLGVSLLPGVGKAREWIAFPLSLGTGVSLLALLTYILFLGSLVWRQVLEAGAYAILLAGIILFAWRLRRREARMSIGWGLPVFVLLITVRLAFVSKLTLPPYSDSPTHYLIVLNMLQPASRPAAFYSFADLFQRYYHFGVHAVTAWTQLASGENSPLMLAIVGQFLLTILPFSIFALAGVLAENSLPSARRTAAWAAALICAFGWWMPAFGANWGKYPSLAGLALLPVPLGYLYAFREGAGKWTRIMLTAFLLAGTVLMHTRTCLLLGLAVVGLFCARLAVRKFSKAPLLAAGIAILLTAAWIYWGWLHPDLAGYYFRNWPLLVLVLILLPSAFGSYPEAALSCLLGLAGIALLSSLHTPSFLAGRSTDLLDRPFTQIVLTLPLALLGGLGVAGLTFQLRARKWLRLAPAILVSLLIIVQMPRTETFFPDPCCSYVTRDDVRAFEWLKSQAPPGSLVVIAGIPTSTRLLETDAGMWVYAMSGLDTAKRSFNSSLTDPAFIRSICVDRKEVYLYAGGGPMSFELQDMLVVSRDYGVVYSSSETHLLWVRACPG